MKYLKVLTCMALLASFSSFAGNNIQAETKEKDAIDYIVFDKNDRYIDAHLENVARCVVDDNRLCDKEVSQAQKASATIKQIEDAIYYAVQFVELEGDGISSIDSKIKFKNSQYFEMLTAAIAAVNKQAE